MDKSITPWRSLTTATLGVSVRLKFTAVVLAVILATSVVMIIRARTIVAGIVGSQLDERTIHTARELAARSQDAVLMNDTFALYQLMRQATRSGEDLSYAFILGQDGEILAHSFQGGVPGDLLKLHRGGERDISLIRISTEEGVIRDAAAPVPYSAGSVVRVGITERLLKESVASSSRTLMIGMLSILVVALLISYGIAALFVRPILDLRNAAQALGSGDFRSRARVWWNDEVGYLAMTFNDMAARLQSLYASLQKKEKAQAKLLRAIISAQEEERKRIARELHDETSQSLASVNVALGAILDSKDARRQTENLKLAIAQALQRIRNLAFELRPGLLDDLGLAAATDRYVESFKERYGLSVDFQSVGMDGRRLSSEIETAVYRIVQEALANAAKHSQAKHVSVIMELSEEKLRVLVEDDGRGFEYDKVSFDGAGRSLGIFGMQERAALIGGSLRIDSAPGEGSTMALDVPIKD
ncbi:MAG: histidine kinase [Armatimonadota bacterium]|nr:histidine kinase [Armatimonadota bacterium]